MALPAIGRARDEVLTELASRKANDAHHHEGRVFSLVYHGGDDIDQLLREATSLYLFENALNPQVFPSLRSLQADVVAITASLLGGDQVDDALAGFMSSGGTESILMAVLAAKEQAAAERGVSRPNMVLPISAHAAFDKAAHYFGIEPRRTPVLADFRADLDAMSGAIDDQTVLVVGSAPQYPQGVVDPIPEIAGMTADRGINCHVDACMGGFVLPFLERLGRFSKPWDFRVPGVTSMSADLHKYGYAAKGASVTMYRSSAYRRYQTFVFDGWLGGMYGSPGVAGSKPANPIAAAWAVLQYLGEDGYLRLTAAAHDAATRLAAGVRAIPGLATVGDPEMTLVAIGGAPDAGVDIFKVSELLYARGWFCDRQTPPDSLHCTCTATHTPAIVAELLADLRAAVEEVGASRTDDRDTNYSSVE
jgi:glutamate/tyrosine decarboxylase-like PLP-dependent enzyme